jgi:hypothetical protein
LPEVGSVSINKPDVYCVQNSSADTPSDYRSLMPTALAGLHAFLQRYCEKQLFFMHVELSFLLSRNVIFAILISV